MRNRWPPLKRIIFLLFSFFSLFSSVMADETKELKQDLTFYLPKSSADRDLIDSRLHREMNARFNQYLFAPWHREADRSEKEEAIARVKRYSENLGYGENKQKHARKWVEILARNANLETYPNTGFGAITVANTDLRELPTHRPHFSSFTRAGEGYPFDNLQYSAIAANTPIFVSHLSRDRAWALVVSHDGTGWVPAVDIASIDQNFVVTWENAPLIAITKDEVPLSGQDGVFRFKASFGWLFPKVGEDDENYQILIAVADENRKALIKKVSLSKKQGVIKPDRLSSSNLATLGNELLHKPYGWGGIYGNRDCSTTLKDLFAPFGIWLPRDSKDQAAQGTFVSLKGLLPNEKEKIILRDGIPFLTLIWMKGHIMLYIGNYRGKAVVFHNLWGVRTKDHQGREGRKVIGQSVISTLYLGMDLPDADRSYGDLLNRVEGMTFLVPPEKVAEVGNNPASPSPKSSPQ
jgi:cell wall-associated NlpC family hydrolase